MKPLHAPHVALLSFLLTLLSALSAGCDDAPRPQPDMALPDMALPDMALPDMALPDMALPDMALPDMALPVCGDGVVNQDDEACDDGNSDDRDGCTNTCALNVCGDGLLNVDVEACDDGNNIDEDSCTNACALNVCGDGVLFEGVEACDEGEANADDAACTSNCQLARCGDGLVRADLPPDSPLAELCDDGNSDDRDACRNSCQPARCGDGVVRRDLEPSHPSFEACDPNADNGPGVRCDDECVVIECGNHKVQGSEQCDDGPEGSETCDAQCYGIHCGNGRRQPGEACDRGPLNSLEPDMCRPTCELPRCGDGIHDPLSGEECDEGPEGGERCRASCVLRRCGDGFVDASIGEACDDANTNETDACNANCQPHRCGDGVRRAGVLEGEEGYEACDWGEGNALEPDACRPTCELPRCGDGVVDTNEACDDADDEELNGCNSACEVAWCGNGVIDAYLLATGEAVESCEGRAGCRQEACDEGLEGNAEGLNGCDSACTLTAYALQDAQEHFKDRSATHAHPDRYSFTLEAPAFVHFVTREGATAQPTSPRCDEARWRTLSLTQLQEGPLGEEERLSVTPSFTGAHLGDEGVCGALQATLPAGRYELSVSGEAGEEGASAEGRDARFELLSYISQALSTRLSAPLDSAPTSVLSSPQAERALHHFKLTPEDLGGADSRILRVVFSSARYNDERGAELAEPCPPLTLKRLQGLSELSELEVMTGATRLNVTRVVDERDPLSCAYEAEVSEGLYELTLTPTLTAHHSLSLAWRDLCGDALRQAGEGCDLGRLAEPTPCSSLCLLTPLNAPDDGVCDPSEGPDEPDCLLTYPLESPTRDWSDGYLRERVVQSALTPLVTRFSLAHPQQLKARAFFCSDPSMSLVVRRDGEPEAIARSLPLSEGESEGSRAQCATLNVTLPAGEYELTAQGAQPPEGLASSAFSYWLEAMRAQPLDDHLLTPELLSEGFTSITSGRARLFTLSLNSPQNVEFSVYDDERRQCESLKRYALSLYTLTPEGFPQRDPAGALTPLPLPLASVTRPSGTAPLSEAVPCARAARSLPAGRYALAVQPNADLDDRDPLPFVAQLLTPRLCGDGRLDAGEECDDGNLLAGDGCTKRCLKEPSCGDGALDLGETCEGDGCSAQCTLCGNGSLDPGEACDDGNLTSGDGCDRLCSLERVEVRRAISAHTGVISQAVYEGAQGPQERPLAERADVYSLQMGAHDTLTAWLCAPLLHTIHPDDSSTEVEALLTELAVRARLVAPSEELSVAPSSLRVVTEAVNTPSLQACDDPNSEGGFDLGLLGEASPEPMPPHRTLTTDLERALWRADERLRCVELTWALPEAHPSGEHLLMIESAPEERWPLYRDYPLTYHLNLMLWRELWVGEAPQLGVSTGALPEGGDRLFKLRSPLLSPSYDKDNDLIVPSSYDSEVGGVRVFEVRTLRDEHFSCPLEAETDLQLLVNPAQLPDPTVSACALYSRLPSAQPCASTRVELEGEGDLFVYLRPRTPTEALSEYALKVRSVDRCGDGLLDWGEQCDDGNLYNEDGCSKVCTFTYLNCGNGTLEVEEGEACDDGNQEDGDGCSARCTNERDTLWLTRAEDAINVRDHDFSEGVPFEASVVFSPVTLTTPLQGTRLITPQLSLHDASEVSYVSCGECDVGGDPNTCSFELSGNITAEVEGAEGDPLLSSCAVSVTSAPALTPTITRNYTLTSSAQVFGELLSLASDRFTFSMETFRSLSVNTNAPMIMLKLAVTDPTVITPVSLNDPPCPEGLDAHLALYDEHGELVSESDDVSATNQCSALFALIGESTHYSVVVTNLSQSSAPYQLQLSSPDFCGNERQDFGEACDPSDPTNPNRAQCSTQCLYLEQ